MKDPRDFEGKMRLHQSMLVDTSIPHIHVRKVYSLYHQWWYTGSYFLSHLFTTLLRLRLRNYNIPFSWGLTNRVLLLETPLNRSPPYHNQTLMDSTHQNRNRSSMTKTGTKQNTDQKRKTPKTSNLNTARQKSKPVLADVLKDLLGGSL